MSFANVSPTDSFTKILNEWNVSNDLQSANQLKSMVYYHLKGIVKKQIQTQGEKLNSTVLLAKLPNTTSFLHDALLALVPTNEVYENREQFYLSLALFVRWMLLDELKAKSAKKRDDRHTYLLPLIAADIEPDPYFSFDIALTKLEKLLPRCYQIAILHYYLGFSIYDIEEKLKLKKSTVYQELATAKAYLRAEYKAA